MRFYLLSTFAVATVAAADIDLQSMQLMQAGNTMQSMMQYKQNVREKQRAAGEFDINRYQRAEPTQCINGKAGEYQCNNVDLLGHLRHQDMGSTSREGSDVWGL
jgi:hypothetical protein